MRTITVTTERNNQTVRTTVEYDEAHNDAHVKAIVTAAIETNLKLEGMVVRRFSHSNSSVPVASPVTVTAIPVLGRSESSSDCLTLVGKCVSKCFQNCLVSQNPTVDSAYPHCIGSSIYPFGGF